MDKSRPTQLGRALKELGMQMIAAYSPQARGRSERSFGTWQGRLPQELRLARIADSGSTPTAFCASTTSPSSTGSSRGGPPRRAPRFAARGRSDLDWVFSIQTERVVSKDNTVAIKDRWWQIDKCRWRHSLAGQTVTIQEHLDDTVSIRYGPHIVGRYTEARGKAGAVEAVENQNQVSHRSPRPLEIASGDSHFPTASTSLSSLS